MTEINYLVGDATKPEGEDNKIILHICNDIGGWGRGFVLAISKRWKEPEAAYRKWFKEGKEFALGKIQLVQVEDDTWVANMIGQHDIRPQNNIPPIRYEAVEICLEDLSKKTKELNASIHMPRIGCGLAGGTWENIEPLIQKRLLEKNVAVFVYDFQPS